MLNFLMRFIIGPPCSGKGTIAKELDGCFNSISAGEILREMAKTDKHISTMLKSGHLVSIELTSELVLKKASEFNYEVLIDGFPRSKSQALLVKNFLEENNIKHKGIFYIWEDDHVLLERTENRFFCEDCKLNYIGQSICCNKENIKRDDDNAETLKTRLKVFYDEIDDILKVLQGPVFYIHNQQHKLKETVKKLTDIVTKHDK